MDKSTMLVNYILTNGKSKTWLELAKFFNIRAGESNDVRAKAANDIWRNYQRKKNRSTQKLVPNKEVYCSTKVALTKTQVENFLFDRQSYLKKSPLEVAKAIWKYSSSSSNFPKNSIELERELEIIKEVQSSLRQAKNMEVELFNTELSELYKKIVQIKERPKRRLFFDIETSPNIVFSWNVGRKINLDPENIVEERAVICVCYKWEGEDEVHSITWEKGDDEPLLRKFSEIIDSADEVIGHNSRNYDVKWIRTRCLYYRIPVSPKFNQIDTLEAARYGFRFNSNRLNYISQFLGIGEKVDTGGFKLWKDIVLNNSEEALDRMVEYCKGDVLLLEDVYNELKEYIPARKFQYKPI